MFLIVHSPESR